jgi:hypothetical protein
MSTIGLLYIISFQHKKNAVPSIRKLFRSLFFGSWARPLELITRRLFSSLHFKASAVSSPLRPPLSFLVPETCLPQTISVAITNSVLKALALFWSEDLLSSDASAVQSSICESQDGFLDLRCRKLFHSSSPQQQARPAVQFLALLYKHIHGCIPSSFYS